MYIDAGTGSLVLQTVVALVSTVVIFFKGIRVYLGKSLSKSHLNNGCGEK